MHLPSYKNFVVGHERQLSKLQVRHYDLHTAHVEFIVPKYPDGHDSTQEIVMILLELVDI